MAKIIQMSFSKEKLEELKNKIKASSYEEVVNKALTILDALADEELRHNVIVSQNEKYETRMEFSGIVNKSA